MRNAQRLAAVFYQFSFSPGNNRDFNTGSQRAADPVAIADVKRFQLFAVVAHIDKTIGKHAVDVEDQ